MKPTELSAALKAIIPTKRPVFVDGPPGVGKTSLFRQVADLLGMRFIDVRAVLLDPVDLRGLPHLNGDGRAHWAAPAFLPHDPEERSLLFFDELPQAPPLVQSACLQIVLDRRIGEYTLPEECVVAAAGNRAQDRTGAHRLISALSSRFVRLSLEVSNDDWQLWAIANNIAPEVRAFLNYRPALLFQFDPSSGQESFPCPRSWDFVSQLIHAVPNALQHSVFTGCVGEGPAAEFIGFTKLYRDLPKPAEILKNPDTAPVPKDPAIMYALVGALVEHVRSNMKDAPAMFKFCHRMNEDFAVLLVTEATHATKKAILKLKEADKWLMEHKAVILSSVM